MKSYNNLIDSHLQKARLLGLKIERIETKRKKEFTVLCDTQLN